MVIEVDASNKAWGGIIIENHENKEEICEYASGAFKNIELNYPSRHKEILAVKKTINHFKLYLKPVKFIVRTYLKIMSRILKNENIMEENISKILKRFLLLQKFDFEIVYKPGYLNCIYDILCREDL